MKVILCRMQSKINGFCVSSEFSFQYTVLLDMSA
jgi:hypothetical protein